MDLINWVNDNIGVTISIVSLLVGVIGLRAVRNKTIIKQKGGKKSINTQIAGDYNNVESKKDE